MKLGSSMYNEHQHIDIRGVQTSAPVHSLDITHKRQQSHKTDRLCVFFFLFVHFFRKLLPNKRRVGNCCGARGRSVLNS